MQSPYENRLLELVANARDDTAAALARAELAGYWARLGRFEEADRAIRDVRERFGDGRSGRVTIMLMCAEAQVLYFRQMHPDARDRLARGQLLSTAGGDRALTALTSAWLAHVDFNLNRYESMAKSIATCMGAIQQHDISAKCRVALTLADAFLTAGETSAARTWYSKAHEIAVQLGDHASMAALTMNRAVLGVFNARLRDAGAPVEASEVSRLAAEVRSAVNYESAAQLLSLKALLDNAAISIMVLEQRFLEAAARIEDLLRKAPIVSPIDSTTLLRCDLVFCLASLARVDDAKREMSDDRLLQGLQRCASDDRLLGYSMLQRACERLQLSREATEYAELGAQAKVEHRRDVETLIAVLHPYRSTAVMADNPTAV